MNPTDVTSGSKTERVWRQADLAEFPELEADAPYREERERASFMSVYEKPPVKPSVQNHRYNPLKWRRR